MNSMSNLSIPSPTNVIRTPPHPSLNYTPTPLYPKHHQTDLSINKSSSSTSTLVNLLKQPRSPQLPPPQSLNQSLSSASSRQQKSNSVTKQPRKPAKKAQTPLKRLSLPQDTPISVRNTDPIVNISSYFNSLFRWFKIRQKQC